jgi:hypothetical protein
VKGGLEEAMEEGKEWFEGEGQGRVKETKWRQGEEWTCEGTEFE